MGKKLKAYLKRNNLKQGEFAKMLGVGESLVSLWISDKRRPGRNRLVQLSQVTGIKIEDLL